MPERRNLGAFKPTRKYKSDTIDYYQTPSWATEALLSRHKFEGRVLEPCCGGGAMSRVLEAAGYDVESSDIREDVYGQGGIDFLDIQSATNIVTNPPYKYAREMIEHGYEIMERDMAMILRLNFLEGQERRALWDKLPPMKVLVFSARVGMFNEFFDDDIEEHSAIAYAWYIWRKWWRGPTTLEWI